ncbi:unnamed protein product, partial [Nesidiocoris tenuis]
MFDSKRILDRTRESDKLPELDKYWQVVREDPSDFNGWTYLLQYVDQENDVEATRDAYDCFLAMYPYCYGYWRKYAEYEKRQYSVDSESNCTRIYQKGLAAVPLSVDLWIHYLGHCKSIMGNNENLLREQFEQAVSKCGAEFRADRLWMLFIYWEMDNRHHQVLALFDRMFQIPLQNLETHFEKFQDFVNSQRPNVILSVDEFLAVRSYVVNKLKSKNGSGDSSADQPPGEGDADDVCSDEEITLVRKRIISLRHKVYKATMAEVAARWPYEAAIKRPYFHIKPLEKSQLNNWHAYLDFEIEHGNVDRAVFLFERCLIACVMYPEFWLKYIKFLAASDCDPMTIRRVYRRACLVHLTENVNLMLDWAFFEEMNCNKILARKILKHAEKLSSDSILVQLHLINFERRCGNLDKVRELFERYIARAAQPSADKALRAKYAQFYYHSLNDLDKAVELLRSAVEKYRDDPRLIYQTIYLYLSANAGFDARLLDLIDGALQNDAYSSDDKLKFLQLKYEYCNDLGDDVAPVVDSLKAYSNLAGEQRNARFDKFDRAEMFYSK